MADSSLVENLKMQAETALCERVPPGTPVKCKDARSGSSGSGRETAEAGEAEQVQRKGRWLQPREMQMQPPGSEVKCRVPENRTTEGVYLQVQAARGTIIYMHAGTKMAETAGN
jgi:hypothetical protein